MVIAHYARLRMVTIAAKPTVLATFPADSIEATLQGELVDAIKAEASIKGIQLPSAPAQILKVPVQVDSLVVVSILCAVEPILGFELSEDVVRAGGYFSVESAVGHLMQQIEKQWKKRKGVTS